MGDADLESIFEQKHKLFYLSTFAKLQCFKYQCALEGNLSIRCLKTSKISNTLGTSDFSKLGLLCALVGLTGRNSRTVL